MILHPSITIGQPARQRLERFLLLWLVPAGILLAACQHESTTEEANSSLNDRDSLYTAAIRTMLSRDGELATIRNHACEDTTLSATIRRYVASIDTLDFSGCPTDFATAFRRHRDAWEKSIVFFEQFDSLRGEMHMLFNTIAESGENRKAAYEQELKAIMDTWGEVEAAALRYQALPEDE